MTQQWKPGDAIPKEVHLYLGEEWYGELRIEELDWPNSETEDIGLVDDDAFEAAEEQIATRLEQSYKFCSGTSLERMSELGSLAHLLAERDSLISIIENASVNVPLLNSHIERYGWKGTQK